MTQGNEVEKMKTLLGEQFIHTCERTGRKYYLTKVKTERLRASELNPRKPKADHVKEIEGDMRDHGQYTPITAVEDQEKDTIDDVETGLPRVVNGEDAKKLNVRKCDISVLDGNHRLIAARRINLKEMDAKVYVPSEELPESAKQRMAEYLNLGVKKINPGEEYYSSNQRYATVIKEIESQGAKVINEARIGSISKIRSKNEIRKFTVGRHVYHLQREQDSPITGMISDAQTPKASIVSGDTHLLTARNVATFLDTLCYVKLIGPWDVVEAHNDPDYEDKILSGEIPSDPDYRDEEYENAKILLEILSEEILTPWLDAGGHDSAMTLCKYHVLKALATCIKQIMNMPQFVKTKGKRIPMASPLFFDNKSIEVDWDLLREHIKKLKNVNWNNPLYGERVPDIIANELWSHMMGAQIQGSTI